MKLLVETTGPFMKVLVNPRQEIEHNRPTVVESSGALDGMIALGDIKVLLGQLHHSATDAEWLTWLQECDDNVELAIASFLAEQTKKLEAPISKKK